jgi:hypothetical protein
VDSETGQYGSKIVPNGDTIRDFNTTYSKRRARTESKKKKNMISNRRRRRRRRRRSESMSHQKPQTPLNELQNL